MANFHARLDELQVCEVTITRPDEDRLPDLYWVVALRWKVRGSVLGVDRHFNRYWLLRSNGGTAEESLLLVERREGDEVREHVMLLLA